MSVVELYVTRSAALREAERRLARKSSGLSQARLAIAGAVILAGWLTTRFDGIVEYIFLGVTLVGIATFIEAVVRHGRVKREEELLGELAALTEAGPARVERRWQELRQEQLDPVPADHPYAIDLDLTGPGSLARLLPPLSPAFGRPLLRDWLLAPAPPDEVLVRQEAVAELVERRELRDLLAVHAARSALDAAYVRGFERWAAEPPWWSSRWALVWITRVLPLVTVALAVWAPGSWWLLSIAAGALLTVRYRQRVTRELRRVSAPVSVFRAYREMVSVILDAEFQAPRLRAIQERLRAGDVGAEAAMRSLGRLADSADLRHSGLQYAIVQGLTLWDFHVLDRLEQWRRRVGAYVPTWFAAIAEMEALAALALLAHDNPDWTFPRLEMSESPRVDARALGHPLLAPSGRVANDVTVGPPGTFLFVTGSNMSGKSTLVRAIGLNVVLAQAGAAVCAAELTLPPLHLHTSMRVQDSLERGVSLFMAEVVRLRGIVESARAATERGEPVLFLLDEILHGTNSAERSIAARAVLRRLVEEGAIGAVTSHDLTLVDTPALRDAAVPVHFREEVVETPEGPRMHFDYALRPGLATTRNALRLMEEMGLPIGEKDPDKDSAR